MRKKISTTASFSVAVLQERSHKVVHFFQYVSKRSICIFYIYVQDMSRKLPKTILLAYTDVQLYYVICLEMGTNFDRTLFVDPKKHLILVYWPCTGLQSMPHSSFCRQERQPQLVTMAIRQVRHRRRPSAILAGKCLHLASRLDESF